MVVCPQCQIQNSLDSHFCKGCGANLPTDAVAEAQSQHEALVAEGYKALNEGRLDEAVLVAASALEEFPESISALTLRGMALERQGHLAEALDTFEKVVAHNPNSALDKIKVQHLRNAMSAKLLQTDGGPANRKVALFAAVAAIVLVGAIGVIAANFAGTGARQDGNVDLSNKFAMQDAENQGAINPNGANQQIQTPNGGAKTGNPNNDPNWVAPEGKKPSTGTNPGLRLPNTGGTQLPEVGNGGSGFGPLNPGNIGVQPEGPTNPTTNGNGGSGKTDKPEDDVDPNIGDGGKSTTTTPTENPGEIVIKTSSSSKAGSQTGGSEVRPSNDGSMGLKALQAAAQQQFQLGKYDQAAKSYERMLGMGADPGRTNQRLGQCYQNLGQSAAAVDAYRRAIAAFEARLKSGTGDKNATESMLASCRAALKVVG